MVKFKLEDIVKQFMIELKEESDTLFHVLLQYGIQGLRELHMDISGAPSWDLIDINSNTQQAILPEDCLRLIQVGGLTSKNNLKPLIRDGNMVLNDTGSQGFTSMLNTYHNYDSPSITGTAYRQDYLNGALKVSSNVDVTCLYVEYLADMEKINGKFMVSPYETEAVKSYIRWANTRSNPNLAESKINRYERYWLRDREQVSNRINSQTLEEMVQDYRRTLTGVVRGI